MTADQEVWGSNPLVGRAYTEIAWNEATRLISKLNLISGAGNFRLPSESEWEYAARAGGNFGINLSGLSSYGWYNDNSGDELHNVATKLPNPWGLYDMHGNVWEMCQDWFGPYESGYFLDPRGLTSRDKKVIRGGSAINDSDSFNSIWRQGVSQDEGYSNLGFRIALDR